MMKGYETILMYFMLDINRGPAIVIISSESLNTYGDSITVIIFFFSELNLILGQTCYPCGN